MTARMMAVVAVVTAAAMANPAAESEAISVSRSPADVWVRAVSTAAAVMAPSRQDATGRV